MKIRISGAIANFKDCEIYNINVPRILEIHTEKSQEKEWHEVFGHGGAATLRSYGKTGCRNKDCLQSMKFNMKSHNAYRGGPEKYKVNIPFHKIHADLCIVQDGTGKPYGNSTPYMLSMHHHVHIPHASIFLVIFLRVSVIFLGHRYYSSYNLQNVRLLQIVTFIDVIWNRCRFQVNPSCLQSWMI